MFNTIVTAVDWLF